MSRAGSQPSPSDPQRAPGEIVDQLRVGPLTITIKHSCLRRDLYDITLGRPFPAEIRDFLVPRGRLRGGEGLFAVDVAGVHQITVAMTMGRMVVMPKMAPKRPEQRSAALALARDVAALVESMAQG